MPSVALPQTMLRGFRPLQKKARMRAPQTVEKPCKRKNPFEQKEIRKDFFWRSPRYSSTTWYSRLISGMVMMQQTMVMIFTVAAISGSQS